MIFGMAADGQITNQKGDPLGLLTVINSTPGLIHTSQPDGYLDFFNRTWLRYVGKPLVHLLGVKVDSELRSERSDQVIAEC